MLYWLFPFQNHKQRGTKDSRSTLKNGPGTIDDSNRICDTHQPAPRTQTLRCVANKQWQPMKMDCFPPASKHTANTAGTSKQGQFNPAGFEKPDALGFLGLRIRSVEPPPWGRSREPWPLRPPKPSERHLELRFWGRAPVPWLQPPLCKKRDSTKNPGYPTNNLKSKDPIAIKLACDL